jgi:hypothetical protein
MLPHYAIGHTCGQKGIKKLLSYHPIHQFYIILGIMVEIHWHFVLLVSIHVSRKQRFLPIHVFPQKHEIIAKVQLLGTFNFKAFKFREIAEIPSCSHFRHSFPPAVITKHQIIGLIWERGNFFDLF